VPDGALEEPAGGLRVPACRDEHVDDLAELVDRAVHVAPLPSDLHIGLIDLPAVTDGVAAGSGGLGQQWGKAHHPAIHHDVVDLDPAFCEQLLEVAVGQAETQISAHREHDHIGREAEPGERRPGVRSRPGAVGSRSGSLAARAGHSQCSSAPICVSRASVRFRDARISHSAPPPWLPLPSSGWSSGSAMPPLGWWSPGAGRRLDWLSGPCPRRPSGERRELGSRSGSRARDHRRGCAAEHRSLESPRGGPRGPTMAREGRGEPGGSAATSRGDGSRWPARGGPAASTGGGRTPSSEARRAPGTPPPPAVVLHGYVGRFAGGIWTPLFRPRPAGSRAPWSAGRSWARPGATPDRRGPVGPLTFRLSLPPSRKSSRQAANRCASTRSSRESSSSSSPRSNLSTVSIFLLADHLGPGPVVTGLLVPILVDRHDRHLHPCLSGVQENRERWTSTVGRRDGGYGGGYTEPKRQGCAVSVGGFEYAPSAPRSPFVNPRCRLRRPPSWPHRPVYERLFGTAGGRHRDRQRLTRPRMESSAKPSSTGPVNRNPIRRSSPGRVSCPDSWRALLSSDTVACSA
jgi:hypothetical protein